jgi:parvulin-like peptidyl-prolyl isomerase
MFQCKAVWLVVLFTGLFAAAWKSNEPPKTTQKKASTPPAADQAPTNEIAAVVNGEKIMLTELVGRLEELNIPAEKREDMAGPVLDAMIDNALIIQFLTAQKIAYDPKLVDSQIAEVREEYEKEGVKFADALSRIGVTEKKLRDSVIADLQWQNYVKKSVSEKQLTEYFTKYREYFDGAEVRASHILVEVPDDADDKARAAAKAKIEKIRKEVNAGLDFGAAARKYSDCPSKEQGGDVDFFNRRDKMVEPFAKAAFALKKGETSGIVETEFGYHIIKVTDRKPAKYTKVDNAELRKDLLEAIGEQMKNDLVASQRKVAKISIAPVAPSADRANTKTAVQPTGKTKK